MKQIDPTLAEVFRAYGTQARLAKELGVTRQAICRWQKVPIKHLRRICAFTGLAPAVLRPDIYGGF